MNTTSSLSGQDLLANMAKIPLIIPGVLSPRKNEKGKITGWKLQHWKHGRNQTRYVSADQVEVVRQGTRGHQEFASLAEAYVQAKAADAMRLLDGKAEPSKKKPTRP